MGILEISEFAGVGLSTMKLGLKRKQTKMET